MILRSLEPPQPGPAGESIWVAVERSQQQDFSAGCWLIPQPAHAALSGDIAKHLAPAAFPGLTPEVVHAIALHDAGWSPDDAAAIQQSRAKGARARPQSFISAAPRDSIAAWTGSIDIAGKASPIGAFIVSRHFTAVAETYRDQTDAATGRLLEAFIAHETARRARLRKKLAHADSELDRIVEALQLCDLLSLYLCCGLRGSVVLPQTVQGKNIRLASEGNRLRLDPGVFAEAAGVQVAALRHPRLAGEGAVFSYLLEA